MHLQRLKKKFRSYSKDEGGNIMIMTAVAVGIIAGMAGLAIETSILREHTATNQDALDASAIAGASKLLRFGNAGQARTTVGQYWAQNNSNSFALDALNSTNVTIQNRRPGVTARITAETFARVDQQLGAAIAGSGQMAGNVSSDVVIDIPPTEITVIADLSGSMANASRWPQARRAINVFGHSFLSWASFIPDTVNMNLIPFGETTNFKDYYWFQQYLQDDLSFRRFIPESAQGTIYRNKRTTSGTKSRCRRISYRDAYVTGNPWSGSGQQVRTRTAYSDCVLNNLYFYPDAKPDPWPSYWPMWGFSRILEPHKAGRNTVNGYKHTVVTCDADGDGDDDPGVLRGRQQIGTTTGTCTRGGGCTTIIDGGTTCTPVETYSCQQPVFGPGAVCYTRTVSDSDWGDIVRHRPYGYMAHNSPQWSGCFDYTSSSWGNSSSRIGNMLKDPDMWLDRTLRKEFKYHKEGAGDGNCTGNRTRFSIKRFNDYKNHVDGWTPDSHTSHDIAMAWTRNFFTRKFDAFINRPTWTDRQYAILLTDGRLFSNSRGNSGAYENVFRDVCNTIKSEGVEVFTIAFDVRTPRLIQLLRDCASHPQDYFFEARPTNVQGVFQAIAGFIKKEWVRLDG